MWKAELFETSCEELRSKIHRSPSQKCKIAGGWERKLTKSARPQSMGRSGVIFWVDVLLTSNSSSFTLLRIVVVVVVVVDAEVVGFSWSPPRASPPAGGTLLTWWSVVLMEEGWGVFSAGLPDVPPSLVSSGRFSGTADGLLLVDGNSFCGFVSTIQLFENKFISKRNHRKIVVVYGILVV